MSDANSYSAQFYKPVKRNGENVWVHRTAPVWIVQYEAIEGSRGFQREFWQPYRAIGKVERGAAVWSANNKRIGDEAEFRSLDAAMQAARAYIESNATLDGAGKP